MKIKLLLRSVKLVSLGDLVSLSLVSDIPFYRSSEGRVAIPGSSVKGVLRTLATNIAKNYDLKVHDSIDPALLEEVDDDISLIFGKPGLSLPILRISTFRPLSDVEPIILTRIKINEKTGKVEEGALFNVEYIPPCTVFSGCITLNLKLLMDSCKESDKAKKLIFVLFKALEALRYNRLGRGDSVYDVKIENIDEVERVLRSQGFEDNEISEILSPLKEFFWKIDICGEEV